VIQWRCRGLECNALLRVADSEVGHRVRCPRCDYIDVVRLGVPDPVVVADEAPPRSSSRPRTSLSLAWAVAVAAGVLVGGVAVLIITGPLDKAVQSVAVNLPSFPPSPFGQRKGSVAVVAPHTPAETPIGPIVRTSHRPRTSSRRSPTFTGASAPPPSSTALSPLQMIKAQEDAIFQERVDDVGDPELGPQYDAINTTYFGGVLPKIAVNWEVRFRDLGRAIGSDYIIEGSTNGKLILLNADVKADAEELRRVLCHEMVHEYLITIGDRSKKDHGARFQEVLRRLWQEGAFEGLPASPEERTRCRAARDAESQRLEAEGEELTNLSAAIERVRADETVSVRTFNQWVDDYDTRRRRHNRDVVAFKRNQEICRLKSVYPDGLESSLGR
jgi:predicted SprT family Zn-dependent metalloprotease/phage FluMu protein Com